MRIGGLGTPELLIILTIVILLFGIGRVSNLGPRDGIGHPRIPQRTERRRGRNPPSQPQ